MSNLSLMKQKRKVGMDLKVLSKKMIFDGFSSTFSCSSPVDLCEDTWC
jgi:hypothetical protein